MTQPPEQPAQPEQPDQPEQPAGQPPSPGWVPTGYYPMPPRHREADKVLVLGLVGLIGGFFCYLPIVAAPFAWVIGNRVTREIEQGQGHLSGHDTANTGRILGMIGTGLLVAGLVVVGVFVGVVSLGLLW